MYRLFTKAPSTALHHHVCFTPASSDSYPRLVRKTILEIILAAVSILTPIVAHAGSATWDLNPTSGDWNTAENWTPTTVPNGSADVATFALSSTTDVSISENTEVNSIVFTRAASDPYTIYALDLTLTISGVGITNNSEVTQNFVTSSDDVGGIVFSNSATAGSNVFIFNEGGGSTSFFNTSTAGNVSILNATTGGTTFWDNSTAGSANIFGYDASFTQFVGHSTAGNATIGGLGFIDFNEFSNAGSATLISASVDFAFQGSISFYDASQGGTARIELLFFPDFNTFGVLDISGHNVPGLAIGSIEGEENTLILLGANNLTVGSNNLSTTFSGVIEDNGFSGSLTKIGTGTLDLTGANTYTGVTNINGGVLQVDGSISSNTFVNNKGTLAGGGTVNGNVTNYSGNVSPGGALGVPGVLTVSNNYMQSPSATLTVQIGGADPGQASVLNVLGNGNLNGALDPELVNDFVPAIGQSFNFLSYASVTSSFSHIKNPVFDHGTKRWSLVYGPNSAYLVVVRNSRGQPSEVLGNYR
jgi:autotransporter-associated beta strand protein